MTEYIVPMVGSVFDLQHRTELVRCKDCKYWEQVPYGHVCGWTSTQKQSGYGYCELGEKKE